MREFVKRHDVCKRNKYETLCPLGLYELLPILSLIWEHISLDFIKGFAISHGKSVVLVVVDYDWLSKYAHFIALSHPYTAKSVTRAFQENVGKLHGMPKMVVSERGPVFLSAFWREFL